MLSYYHCIAALHNVHYLLFDNDGMYQSFLVKEFESTERMVTVIKQDPQGREKIRYQGEVIEHLADGVVIQADWTMPRRDLGYVVFEPGDHFVEYYYTNRWFNIFDIADTHGTRKGWYCNIAEPAQITGTMIEQVDLFLDVWVSPQGKLLILDEDEFEADRTMSDAQRHGAKLGLQALLRMLEARQEMFSSFGAST